MQGKFVLSTEKDGSTMKLEEPETQAARNRSAIYQVVRSIPKGKVCTYGQVAALAGLARAARLVGHVLRGLPKGTQLPWHRVINAQGKLSLPEDSPSYAEQRKRLQEEDVCFVGNRVRLKQFGWKPGSQP